MKRKIIHINKARCNGCGLCAAACHEGAIGIVAGKAELLREDYCDGLGDCLPACPTGAITFEEREAPAYDAAAVQAAKKAQDSKPLPCGCPGAEARTLQHENTDGVNTAVPSRLSQWPVQIRLLPSVAPYFNGASLLVAADCTAYAYGNFHNDFLRGRVALVGCPKLDPVDYAEKLTEIFAANDVQNITVARMSVPCCGGLENAVKRAIAACGKEIPLQVATITPDGKIMG